MNPIKNQHPALVVIYIGGAIMFLFLLSGLWGYYQDSLITSEQVVISPGMTDSLTINIPSGSIESTGQLSTGEYRGDEITKKKGSDKDEYYPDNARIMIRDTGTRLQIIVDTKMGSYTVECLKDYSKCHKVIVPSD